MSPFKSIRGRALGKMLEGFKSSDIGKGFGSGGSGGPITATGGSLLDDGDHWINVFTTVGQSSYVLTCPPNGVDVDILMVGGGGAGGGNLNGPPNYGGGGGGAGGMIQISNYTLQAGAHPISVGAGGGSESNGSPTFIVTDRDTITAYGGGRGAAFPGVAAKSGGSGGGATPYEGTSNWGEGNKQTGSRPGTPIAPIPDVPGTPQGNNGSASGAPIGGGGGGAGQAGQGTAGGGNGLANDWIPPSYGTPGPTPGRWFAGGGGGGNYGNSNLIPGGVGGGGNGGNCSGGSSGAVNTGGGGGGSGCTSPGRDGEPGGSGILAIKVQKIV